MRSSLTISSLVLSIATLSGCGGGKEDSQVTETRMDDIDSLEGTISDEMINTDESTDEGPFDAAPAGEGKPKAADEDGAEEKTSDKTGSETEEKAEAE